MGQQRRLKHLSLHIVHCAAQPVPLRVTNKVAADASLLERPWGQSDVRPTDDPAVALDNFRREGFCVLKGVLCPAEVQMYAAHPFCARTRAFDPLLHPSPVT